MTKANAGTGDSGLGRIEALERLGRLRADGLLTEDEFVSEKARVLDGANPTVPASSTEAAPGPAGTVSTAGTAAATRHAPTAVPDDNDLLAPIRPIANDQYAGFLVSKVWTGVAALICVEAVSVIARVIQLLDGRGWASSASVPTGLALSAGYFLLAGLILWGLGRWVSRRASRVGAVVLIVLAMGALTNAVLRPMADGLWLKIGGVALSAFALWFLMGTARGAFALGGRPAPAEPAPGKPSAREAWSQGRKAAAPIRKIIGWIALGWLGLFLIGGVWFWWSTRDNELAARPMVTPAANAPMPAAPDVATAAPVGELIPMQSPQAILGVWVDEGGGCASDAAFELEEGGRLLAFGVQGSWLLSAGSLTMKTQEVDMDTEQPVGQAYEYTGVVQLVGPNEFHLAGNGPVRRYRRCNADGTEPW